MIAQSYLQIRNNPSDINSGYFRKWYPRFIYNRLSSGRVPMTLMSVAGNIASFLFRSRLGLAGVITVLAMSNVLRLWGSGVFSLSVIENRFE